MKINFVSRILVLLVILSFFPNISHAFEPVGLEGNNIIVENHGSNTFLIIRYAQESRWCGTAHLRGIIGWKKEQLTFPGTGRYFIPMDLSQARSGESYCVIIVNHTNGHKHRLDCKIVNGQFMP